MFEIISAAVFFLYLVQSLLLIIGAKRKFPRLSPENLPTATVLVAAKNEENNILSCIESLSRLEYPEGRLQIILIDDNSTDRTSEIIDNFIKDKPVFLKVKPPLEKGVLKGKTNALAHGIKFATGKVILTTDADCVVNPLWASTICSYYTEGVGLVNGYTPQTAVNGFEGMQHLDFMYLLTVAAGMINYRMPISCIGNNMSYLKEAYDKVGGYESLPFSITEDLNLLMAIHRLKKYRIIYPRDISSTVVSAPCENYGVLYRQKKRWGIGGINAPAEGYLVLGTSYFMNLLMIAGWFFLSLPVAAIFAGKILLDILLLYVTLKDLQLTNTLRFFPAFELYFIIYVIILPFVVFSDRTVEWKGRTFVKGQ